VRDIGLDAALFYIVLGTTPNPKCTLSSIVFAANLALPALLMAGLAYLAGSLSTAIIVCRVMGLGDPRTAGSGNPGATNVGIFARRHRLVDR